MPHASPEGPDRFRTVMDGPGAEIKVKGSRFLGRAFHAPDGEAALARLAQLRRAEHDATHHAWALRLGTPEELQERHDDDGEPSGSAGPPILQQLQRTGVHAALCVVARWYGGTRLGTGGLVRAYGEAAAAALERAPQRTLELRCELSFRVPFALVGAVEAELARRGDQLAAVERDFTADAGFRVEVARGLGPGLAGALREATAGGIDPRPRELGPR